MATNTKFEVSFAPTARASLTLRDKIRALILVVKLVPALPFIIISAFIAGKTPSGKPWQYELRTRLINFVIRRTTPKLLNINSPPTATRIQTEAKRLGASLETVDIGHDAKIHWYGEKKGLNVILHYHGGGFNLPIGNHHVGFLHRTQRILKKRGLDVDIAILEYTLAPVGRYPKQWQQAVEGLRYVLSQGYDPAKIVISGDSAGGTLVFGVVSHILHPHPAIQPLVLPESSPKLGGLIAISPWINLSTSGQNSFKTYRNRDVVMEHFVETWSRWIVDKPGEPRHKDLPPTDTPYTWDEYNNPISADSSWWAGYPIKKSTVLIGGEECMRDSIVEFGAKFKDAVEKDSPAGSGLSVDVVICEGEIHTECLYDTFLPIKQEMYGRMAESTWALYEDVFKAA